MYSPMMASDTARLKTRNEWIFKLAQPSVFSPTYALAKQGHEHFSILRREAASESLRESNRLIGMVANQQRGERRITPCIISQLNE